MTFSKPRYRGFPSGSMVKSLPANAVDAGDTVQSQDPEDPLEKEMATNSSILPGKFHAQWSLVSYSLSMQRVSKT